MAVFDRFLGWLRERSRRVRRSKAARKVNIRKLSRLLHYPIKEPRFFIEALSHRSYLQVSDEDGAVSNERLEFLGDAVLNLAVAEYLYRRFGTAQEGELTKVRARLVNRKALSIYARELRLNEFVRMSPSAAQVATKGLDTILADAFEALIGAIYLDGGYERSKRFVEATVLAALRTGAVKIEDENFKSKLLEYSQAEGMGAPRYITINEEGPDHDRTFTIEVFIGSESYGVGLGKNKKDAEQAAAEKAIQQLNIA